MDHTTNHNMASNHNIATTTIANSTAIECLVSDYYSTHMAYVDYITYTLLRVIQVSLPNSIYHIHVLIHLPDLIFKFRQHLHLLITLHCQ